MNVRSEVSGSILPYFSSEMEDRSFIEVPYLKCSTNYFSLEGLRRQIFLLKSLGLSINHVAKSGNRLLYTFQVLLSLLIFIEWETHFFKTSKSSRLDGCQIPFLEKDVSSAARSIEKHHSRSQDPNWVTIQTHLSILSLGSIVIQLVP